MINHRFAAQDIPSLLVLLSIHFKDEGNGKIWIYEEHAYHGNGLDEIVRHR